MSIAILVRPRAYTACYPLVDLYSRAEGKAGERLTWWLAVTDNERYVVPHEIEVCES
jgi:NO-binding membrane sensor protein with MHYT domain